MPISEARLEERPEVFLGSPPASVACSCSQVHELPHDVLCDIFYACTLVYTAKPHDLGWISLSHVSRRWREVLLDLPNLWARIVCLYPDALEQILLRARNTPLLLDYNTLRSRSDAQRFLELLPRAFCVIDNRKRVWHKQYCHWEAILPGMALPYLTELDITGVPHLGRIHLYPEERQTVEDKVSVDAPALQILCLHGISLSFHAPRLRTLYIEHHHSGLDTDRTLPELLVMLSRHSLLEHLTLLHAVHPVQDAEASTHLVEALEELLVGPHRPIDLSHLTDLRLGGHPRDLTTLWKSMKIPRRAAVRFESTLTLAEPGILITQLMQAVQTHINDSNNDTVTLKARKSQWDWLEGTIGPAVDASGGESTPVSGSFAYSLTFRVPAMLSQQAFAYTISAFVLAAVPYARTLRLNDYSLGPDPLEFGASSIRTLYVQGLEAQRTAATILRNGLLPELRSAEVVIEGDATGNCADIIEALQMRVSPTLKQLVLRGPARYIDHKERDEELELLQDAVDVLVDRREYEVEDEGSGGKARKLAGLGVALLLSSVTLLQT